MLFSALDRWTEGSSSWKETSEFMQDYSSQEGGFSIEMDGDLCGEEAPFVDDSRAGSVPVFQIASPSDTLPVNIELALSRFDDDQEFLRQMLRQYKDQLPERILEIQMAVQVNDANRLARRAHNIKGVSLNFNAARLAHVAFALEESGKRENFTDAPSLVEELELEARRVTEYLSDNGY